ncbi:MAG: ABC transporter ATP-binding protein [Alphaproteobacteria bacterium]|nr:ABC transporter ATP-binding protein [Alphaproteobacteria bacterium]
MTPSNSAAGLPDNAIEIAGLSKTYAGGKKTAPKQALNSVDLTIPRGSLFALLGPNGAGKSTLINVLAGMVIKTEGRVKIWDIDIDQDHRNAKAAIGIVPQELNIDPFFTPEELLEVQAGLYGVPPSERRTDEILRLIGLEDKRAAYARTLSGGMRRRLLIGKAMVHNPPILVLDEPTAGVDIELRQQLWENVVALNKRGTTILLTTHYLEEAEELCDRIAIINHGRVVANDDKKSLLGQLDSKTMVVTVSKPLSETPATLADFNAALTEDGLALHVTYKPSSVKAGQILAAVQGAGLQIEDISTVETDLEDIFLQLTKSEAA